MAPMLPVFALLLSFLCPSSAAIAVPQGSAVPGQQLSLVEEAVQVAGQSSTTAREAYLDRLAARPGTAAAALERLADRRDELRPGLRGILAELVARSPELSGGGVDPGAPGAEAALLQAALPFMGDPDPEVRRAIIGLMARPDLVGILEPERVAALTRMARSVSLGDRSSPGTGPMDPDTGRAVFRALGRIGDGKSAAALGEAALMAPDPTLRRAAARALVGAADGGPEVLKLVRSMAFGLGATSGPGPEVLAVLLPRYGAVLADRPGASDPDLVPLILALKHPNSGVRGGAADAVSELLDRLAASEDTTRASTVLGRLKALGVEGDTILYQRARLSLSSAGDPRVALEAALELVGSRGLTLRPGARIDAYESQLWMFRGQYLAGMAELALMHPAQAKDRLDAAAQALDAALIERRDLLERPERVRHIDLLHQRALVDVARTLATLAASDEAALRQVGEVLEFARSAHEIHLEAQAVYAELDGDVLTGWDALLDSALSPYRLIFSRRGFRGDPGSTLPRARIVELQGLLGSALAAVAPGELPGFDPLVPVGPPEVTLRVVDPLADPPRQRLFERIRNARLSGINEAIGEAEDLLSRANDRSIGIIPEAEIERVENLYRRRFAANRASADAARSEDRQWMRDLRVPGSAALWYAQDLKEEGQGLEARVVAKRLEADITERGISNWWFVLGHERVVRAQLLVGSILTDEGRGEEAEEVLTRAVERIEDIERDLSGRGATFRDLAGFRGLRSTALVSLAVNANVRLKDKGKALGYYERAYELRQDEFMQVLMACYRARSGQAAEARSLLRSIRPGPGTWYNLACTHALLGDRSRALDYLEAELELNHGSIESANHQRTWAKEDPDLAGLRGDERFERLVTLR